MPDVEADEARLLVESTAPQPGDALHGAGDGGLAVVASTLFRPAADAALRAVRTMTSRGQHDPQSAAQNSTAAMLAGATHIRTVAATSGTPELPVNYSPEQARAFMASVAASQGTQVIDCSGPAGAAGAAAALAAVAAAGGCSGTPPTAAALATLAGLGGGGLAGTSSQLEAFGSQQVVIGPPGSEAGAGGRPTNNNPNNNRKWLGDSSHIPVGAGFWKKRLRPTLTEAARAS